MYTSGWPKIQNRCCHSTGRRRPDDGEERGAEVAVEDEQEQRHGDDRDGEQQQELR